MAEQNNRVPLRRVSAPASGLNVVCYIDDKGLIDQVTEKFKKRIIRLNIVEEINGVTYNTWPEMQLVQGSVTMVDHFEVGDAVRVYFNLKGYKWEKDGKTFFNNQLTAWKIEGVKQEYAPHAPHESGERGASAGVPIAESGWVRDAAGNPVPKFDYSAAGKGASAGASTGSNAGAGNQGFGGNQAVVDDLPF